MSLNRNQPWESLWKSQTTVHHVVASLRLSGCSPAEGSEGFPGEIRPRPTAHLKSTAAEMATASSLPHVFAPGDVVKVLCEAFGQDYAKDVARKRGRPATWRTISYEVIVRKPLRTNEEGHRVIGIF